MYQTESWGDNEDNIDIYLNSMLLATQYSTFGNTL